jgi:hypothetical protein
VIFKDIETILLDGGLDILVHLVLAAVMKSL